MVDKFQDSVAVGRAIAQPDNHLRSSVVEVENLANLLASLLKVCLIDTNCVNPQTSSLVLISITKMS
jgi:hypothetical protein